MRKRGYLWQPKGRNGRPGRIWWVKYYMNGRPIRESTGTDKETLARRMLQERVGRVAAGLPVLPRADRIFYEEIAKDLRQHYEATGRRNLAEAEFRLAHLDPFFRGSRAAGITAATATEYVVKRQREKAANATINRELAVLNRMLRLAYERGKLLRLPIIRLLKENAPRQGFFEREQYEAVRRRLRPDLQVAVGIAYTLGWRVRSEVLTLTLRQVDLKAGTLRLEPGTTKNDDGRVVYLPADLKALVAAQVDRVKALERQLGRIIPFVFPHLRGQRAGERIRNFQRAWWTACKKAGCPGMLRHDCRRTAVRTWSTRASPSAWP